MEETLLEYTDSRGATLAVDREAGVIRGVKILGAESRNGRLYPHDTLVRARELYEGAKVNVNHPKGSPLGPRDYQDRIGLIRNVSIVGEAGLFGDLHFNPRHGLAGQLEWDAQHAPENVGLSHNVVARTSKRDELTVVEAITRVVSVDLVADPASTHGLFEQVASPDTAHQNDAAIQRLEQEIATLKAALVREEVDPPRRIQARDQQSVERAEGERASLERTRPVDDADAFVRAITKRS